MPQKLKMCFLTLATEEDTNFIEIKCCYFLVSVKVITCIYYHTYFELNINNMKRTWKGINILINRKKKSDTVITSSKCLNDNSITPDPTEIPDILNKHFASIGHKLGSKIPTSVEFS